MCLCVQSERNFIIHTTAAVARGETKSATPHCAHKHNQRVGFIRFLYTYMNEQCVILCVFDVCGLFGNVGENELN